MFSQISQEREFVPHIVAHPAIPRQIAPLHPIAPHIIEDLLFCVHPQHCSIWVIDWDFAIWLTAELHEYGLK